MSLLLDVAVLVVALAAALRSTWSPCGLSMLSSITPMGESARGHRFASTAAWFVAGAVLGGACLGGLAALAAAGVAVLRWPIGTRLVVGAVLALVAALADLGWLGRLGIRLPLLRRQVNERWLDQFRSWVYGAGFGWQIGVGIATYIMTAAVPLTAGLGALTGRPAVALVAGVAFGAFRGLAVLLGRRASSPAALQQLHRSLDRRSEAVRRAVIALQLVLAGVLGGLWWRPTAVLAGGGAAVAVAVVLAVALLALRRLRPRRRHLDEPEPVAKLTAPRPG
ncbi:MAG: hypothetical protein ACYC1D_09595 [Acidimicrobiales bacterium]